MVAVTAASWCIGSLAFNCDTGMSLQSRSSVCCPDASCRVTTVCDVVVVRYEPYYQTTQYLSHSEVDMLFIYYKKHLRNVGPIRHCEPPQAACSNFTFPFTRCRYCRTLTALKSMSTTTTTTTRDRGERYGPIEWANYAEAAHTSKTHIYTGKSKLHTIC